MQGMGESNLQGVASIIEKLTPVGKLARQRHEESHSFFRPLLGNQTVVIVPPPFQRVQHLTFLPLNQIRILCKQACALV